MSISQHDLETYLDQWQRKTQQLVTQQYFRGTVKAVTLTKTGWVCSVQRQGSSVTDANAYACANPGYAPQIGDDVECMQRDANSYYVMWPIQASPVGAQATALGALGTGRCLGTTNGGPPGYTGSGASWTWITGTATPNNGDYAFDLLLGGIWLYLQDGVRGWVLIGGSKWRSDAVGATNNIAPPASQFVNYSTSIDPLSLFINSGNTNFRIQAPNYLGNANVPVFGGGPLWRVSGAVSYSGANADVRVHLQQQTSGVQYGANIDQSAIAAIRTAHFDLLVNTSSNSNASLQVGVVLHVVGGANNVVVVNDALFTYLNVEYVGFR